MNISREIGKVSVAAVAAAAIAFGIDATASAGSATGPAMPNATPLIQPVQATYPGTYYGGQYYLSYSYYPWRRACPYQHHWECRFDVNGFQRCFCRPDLGFGLF